MTTSRADQGNRLLSDAEMDSLFSEVRSFRDIPKARDLLTLEREFHGWTLNKLEVFENYLKMYRRVAGGGTFIDAFAGTGKGVHHQNGQRSANDGSALIAAKSGAFASLHLIEYEKANLRLLNGHIGSLTLKQQSKIATYNGDCNSIIPRLLDSGTIDEAKPCFALLDQESTQLAWNTIESLADWKIYEPPDVDSDTPKKCKVELWILFNSHQVMSRLWPRDHEKYPDSFSPQTLDRVFGSRDVWWDLWKENRSFRSLLGRFRERLYDLGYQYVVPQLIMDPVTNRPQYHMVHVTDHPSAVSLMRWARRSTDGYENQHLPGMEPTC